MEEEHSTDHFSSAYFHKTNCISLPGGCHLNPVPGFKKKIQAREPNQSVSDMQSPTKRTQFKPQAAAVSISE